MEAQTTEQVAKQLGMTHRALITFLNRNPLLRPKNKTGNERMLLHLWTKEEIERIRQHREANRPGRRVKQAA